ncbi:hypothetical protein [Falsarthrobacter nasiphocae]|uniref:Membrane protein DedA with SNARE-associated domain n=1 Tax=Falsarthrobacter nasiphocae TaxID=189863 RepID=A0AAE3YE40_9MICC|nr:hypothetical protein [Falsarthrobacter nasiphocae]MDR6891510.1 membrane protein DedA with SNARE-associated domain [Falsarthrobacter nasiphocae]
MGEWLSGMHWTVAVAAFWALGIVRSSAVYALGRLASAGGTRSERLRAAFDTPAYRRAETFVNRWGAFAVPVCYLTIGFQTAVIVTTGFTRMPLTRWIPAMLLGTCLWGVIYGTVGMAVIWAWLSSPWVAAGLLGAVVLAVTVAALLPRVRAARASLPPEDDDA